MRNAQKTVTEAIPRVVKLTTVQTIRDHSKGSEMSNEQGNPAIPARDLRRSIVLDLV